MSRQQRRNRRGEAPESLSVRQRLSKAFAHPLRAELLVMLNEEAGSPDDLVKRYNEKFAEETDLNLVAYHVRVLDKFDLIELVKTEQRRGATKHIYVGKAQFLIDDGEWPHLSKATRTGISAGAIGETVERLQVALKQGTFDSRTDRQIVNLKLNVDEEAWTEITEIVKQAWKRAEDAAGAAINRTPDPDQRFPITVSLLAFESPPPSAVKRGEKKED